MTKRCCHNSDNSRLAPSENARKANRYMQTDASKCSPLNRILASKRATQARSLLVLFSLKSVFSLYLLYLDSSLSSRHSWHLYVSVHLMSLTSLPFTFRLLIPGPTCPQSRLSKYLLIHSFTFCHDCDIPPQPSHTYLCPLAVQTPPEHPLTKPKPIPGLPNPSIACPNSSAAFPKGCCTDICLVSIPEAVNTIPEHL